MSAERPLTQHLILDVLAARLQHGDSLWTFPVVARPHLRKLEEAGLVSLMHGITERTVRAGLTIAGITEAVDPGWAAGLIAYQKLMDKRYQKEVQP